MKRQHFPQPETYFQEELPIRNKQAKRPEVVAAFHVPSTIFILHILSETQHAFSGAGCAVLVSNTLHK